MEEDNTKDAKFSLNTALLNRLDMLMTNFDDVMLKDDFKTASDLLLVIHDEIEYSFSADEKKFVKDREATMLKLYDKYEKQINVTFNDALPNGNVGIFIKFPRERALVKNNLRVFNRLLRQLMKEKGMLIKSNVDKDIF